MRHSRSTGGLFSFNLENGDDSGIQTTFVADGYESKLNETTGLYDVAEKPGFWHSVKYTDDIWYD